MSLPESFSYFVNRLQGGVVRNSVKIVPKGTSDVRMNSSCEFEFPSDTICDLTTATLRAKFRYKNAAGGVNGVRAVPPTHTLFRNVQWSLNNNVVSGNNTGQLWGRMYEALRRCVGSEHHENAHLDEYRKTPLPIGGAFQGSELATESLGQLVTFSDWCGLAHSPNAASIDSALVGNIKLRLDLAGDEVVYSYADSGTNSNDWLLEGVEMTVDCITFTGANNIYDDIMGEMLSSGQELYIPYPEWYASLNKNAGTIKMNVASSSVDVIGFMPLASEGLVATQLPSTGGDVSNPTVEYGPRAIQFKLQNSSNALPDENSEAEKYFFNVNQRVFPQYGAEPHTRGVVHTKHCFSDPKDYVSSNLLFKGNYLDDGSDTKDSKYTYNRRNQLAYNCIIAHKLCLDAPAHQSRYLSGVNTQGQSSTLSLTQTGVSADDYTIAWALTSAVLSVGMGQSVSVVY